MRVFIVLLALLLVLFAVGIGLGARDDSGRKADPKEYPSLDYLTRPFQRGVATEALAGSCLSDRSAVLGLAGACEIEIAPADEEVRILTLSLEQGFQVAFDFQPKSGPPDGRPGSPRLDVQAKLRSDREASREMRLSVPEDGATLILACIGSGGCRVRLD